MYERGKAKGVPNFNKLFLLIFIALCNCEECDNGLMKWVDLLQQNNLFAARFNRFDIVM